MTFYRSLIQENTPLPFKESFDFSAHDYKKDYPLLNILEAKGEGEVFRYKKGIAVYLRAKAKVVLSDARIGIGRSTRLGSTRLGSTRLGSARLCAYGLRAGILPGLGLHGKYSARRHERSAKKKHHNNGRK